MNKSFFTICVVSLMLLLMNISVAQDNDPQETIIGQKSHNTITTAVPFLNIGPDARTGGMGELGVAIDSDINSQHWNAAKYAFIERDMGVAISYSPWLQKLVNDINLYYLAAYKRLNDKSALSFSLRFFSLGDITFTDMGGEILANHRPNEYAVDAGYSRKLSEKLSLAVVGRFIHSNLTMGQEVQGELTKPGVSVAADVGLYYNNELNIDWLEASDISLGVNISNIGSKISYSDDAADRDFIPTNLRIGSSWLMEIDEYNAFRFSLDLNKLLVPTPPIYYEDTSGNRLIYKGMNPDVSVPQGMIQSFYDAPDGFNEEIKEIIWIVGAEYWYDKQFCIRGGYFHESKMKGNRQFFTLGAGLRYNLFGLDFSYLIPTDQQNPLANTLRFTLTFDFDGFNNNKGS